MGTYMATLRSELTFDLLPAKIGFLIAYNAEVHVPCLLPFEVSWLVELNQLSLYNPLSFPSAYAGSSSTR